MCRRQIVVYLSLSDHPADPRRHQRRDESLRGILYSFLGFAIQKMPQNCLRAMWNIRKRRKGFTARNNFSIPVLPQHQDCPLPAMSVNRNVSRGKRFVWRGLKLAWKGNFHDVVLHFKANQEYMINSQRMVTSVVMKTISGNVGRRGPLGLQGWQCPEI